MQIKWTSESVKSAFQETYFPESLHCQECQTALGPSWGCWRDDATHWPRAADIVLLPNCGESLSLCLMGTEIWLQVFICMLISKPVKRIGESGVSWDTTLLLSCDHAFWNHPSFLPDCEKEKHMGEAEGTCIL